MKCLQCGTELDRLSKWRGSSDYCSEECKKESQEEFNRLAMNRLMQPRPVRTNARAAASAVRTVESASGRLTMVTHPVGASSPIVTEPPEAAFIMDITASLTELQLRHQPYVVPRPATPSIPLPELPMGDALLALEAILKGIRPAQRASRSLSRLPAASIAHPRAEGVALPLPACEPVWPESLGLSFYVAGIDHLPASAASVSKTVPAGEPGPTFPPAAIAHRAIPSRRPARQLESQLFAQTGTEYFLAAPVPSAPRLRIHLPKPVLNPYRPRYAFAPREVSAIEAEPIAAPVVPAPGKAADRAVSREETVVEPPLEVPTGKQATVPPAKTETTAPEPKPAAPVAETPSVTKVESKSRSKADQKQATKNPERVEGKVAQKPEPRPRPSEPQKPATAKVEAPVPVNKPEPAKSEAVPASYSAPSFGGQADVEPGSFFSRMPGWQKLAAAVAVIGIAIGAWAIPAMNRTPARAASPSVAAPAAMGADAWETDSSGDTAGIARRRVISHYKPARTKRDYIFEFTGQIEQRAMGWVFRMKDARNYYCLKLEKTAEGPSAPVQLVKFAVVNGEEQPHRLVSLRQPLLAGAPVRIRLDVRGQNFATQVDGQPVDVWIDNQIGEGTVGFSNESGERAVIRTVKVSY